MSTLRADQYVFFNISCSFLLKMRNVSHKRHRENHTVHFMFNNLFSKIAPFVRLGRTYCRAG